MSPKDVAKLRQGFPKTNTYYVCSLTIRYNMRKALF
jgi:hypothetical protein